MAEGRKNYKIWKANKETEVGMMVTPDMVVMAGSSKNFIAIDKNATFISGPISMNSTSDQIRQGGLFVQMNDFVKMVPGTIVTPIPQQIPFPPVQFFAQIAQVMPALMALIK